MNSECSEHQKKIAAFLLGELTGEEKQALEAHLATCSICTSERASYARTIQQLNTAGDEEIPHHFFIYPEERSLNLWQLFRGMTLGWQGAGACAVVLVLLLGIAAVSRLQVRSGPEGLAISFGSGQVDMAAFKKDILDAAERRNQESRTTWLREVRGEIERSHAGLTKQQQIQLTAALTRMDSRLNGRVTASEAHVRDETQKLVSDFYQVVQNDRAQDLEAINLRLDRTDANNDIKSRQTNRILGTLLQAQVADLKLYSGQ